MSRRVIAKGIERFFLSRKVAVILLVLTLLLLVLSTRLENISTLTTSPFFLTLPLLIFMSILFCTINRIKGRRLTQPVKSAFRVVRDASISGEVDLRRIEDHLSRRGWKKYEGGETHTTFTRGQSGFWGSMAFHAGILLLLVAGMVTGVTSFSGELLLTQELPAALGREGFLKIWKEPLWPIELPRGEIILERFDAVFKDDRFPVDYVAKLRVKDNKGDRVVDVRVNDPLIIGQLQYTMDEYGFAPGFLVKDKSGKVVYDGYVALKLLGGAEDYFDIPGTDAVLYVRFFPDQVTAKNGAIGSRSNIPKNPVFGMRLKRGGIEAGRGKLVKLGKSVELGGLEISLYEFRYWTHFAAVKDTGRLVFMVSLLLMVGGLLLRFLYNERWLMVSYVLTESDLSHIELAGFSRYFPALFEGEVEKIVNGISSLQ